MRVGGWSKVSKVSKIDYMCIAAVNTTSKLLINKKRVVALQHSEQ